MKNRKSKLKYLIPIRVTVNTDYDCTMIYLFNIPIILIRKD